MSCSRWNPWQYDPRDPRFVMGVGLLPLFDPKHPSQGFNAPPSSSSPPAPPTEAPRTPTEANPPETPAQGTDTARPDVATIAIGVGIGLVLASMLAGARGFGAVGMGGA